MKLYTGMGPNPRVVLVALAELGTEVEMQNVDLMEGTASQPSGGE